MRWLTSTTLSILVLLAALAASGWGAAEGPGRRRRVKKIVARTDLEGGGEVGAAGTEAVTLAAEVEAEVQEEEEEDRKKKIARGFLDDYYQKFESRTEKISSMANHISAEPVKAAPPLFSAEPVPVQETRPHPAVVSQSGERRSDGMSSQVAQLKAQEQQLLALLARESELSPDQREQLLEQLELWEEKRAELEKAGEIQSPQAVVQPAESASQISAYATHPGINKQYQHSNNQLTGERFEKSVPFLSQMANPLQGYLSEVLPNSAEDNGLDTRSSFYQPPSYSGSGSSVNAITKYFGLAGSTSQDIHLGLTFTVPFLSIPLNSINSIIGGNFGDIGNLFNFGNIDTSAIITAAVLGIAAIFILPQAIQWLTGINISPFNWGRSEDEGGAGMIALANTVDSALLDFNIDSRGCIAKTLCTALYDEEEKSSSYLVKSVAKSALRNKFLVEFIGMERSAMLDKLSKTEGGVGGTCRDQFTSTCPWDASAMSSIIMKIMESQGTNIAEIMFKAAAAAATS